MTDKIKPALTPEEWANPNEIGYFDWPNGTIDISGSWRNADEIRETPAKMIALANAALPDSDPRKITRKRIRLLRAAAESHDAYDSIAPFQKEAEALLAFAAALESYLPPEQ